MREVEPALYVRAGVGNSLAGLSKQGGRTSIHRGLQDLSLYSLH
jgi:hypothetical protein